jgi:hypothetical protein
VTDGEQGDLLLPPELKCPVHGLTFFIDGACRWGTNGYNHTKCPRWKERWGV